jgi:hypothetical protein
MEGQHKAFTNQDEDDFLYSPSRDDLSKDDYMANAYQRLLKYK